jgi:cytidylate kinase
MTGTIASERCLEFVQSQARLINQVALAPHSKSEPSVVTISREAGSGAHVVSEELLRLLQARASGAAIPWKIFDRELVEKVLEEHDLPDRMAEFMSEDRMSAVADALDELFGFHPSAWSLVRKTAETILHLAELGNVIIIGRAGNIVTQHTVGAIHVRLVGSRERRIAHVIEYHGLSHEEASDYVREHDLGRKRYVEKYYSGEIDDPLLYDMVLNTDRLGYEDTARVIADAVNGGAAHRRVRSKAPARPPALTG